ncbi:MAG: response regulator [Candidatus Riflebacteria bacterium]|nr:response regulator [Candidatus Riflebacteria bacterium]
MAPLTPRILVVDGDAQVCDDLQVLLARAGHEVSTSTSPAVAAEMVLEAPFDLLIADLRMPGMAEADLLGLARKARPDTDVIVLTGNASGDAPPDALRPRVFDYIEKPVDGMRLLHTVGNALAKRALSTELQQTIREVARLNLEFKRTVRCQLSREHRYERISAAAAALADLARSAEPFLVALGQVAAGEEPDMARLRQLAGGLGELIGGAAEMLAQRHMRKSPGDLKTFIGLKTRELAMLFPAVRVELELPASPVDVAFDPGFLGQAWGILVNNAIQAMNENGTLRVTATGEVGSLTLEIVDDGPGLSPESMASCSVWFTGGDAMGLGLAIARSTVEAHGGRLRVANRPAGGAMVEMTLPILQAGPAPGAQPGSDDPDATR